MRTNGRVLTWAIVAIMATLGGLLSSSVTEPRPAHSAILARLPDAQVAAQPAADSVQPQAAAPTITATTPTCYRPQPYTDACYIEWGALAATAVSPAYMISMTVAIDGRERVYVGGFFQTAMNLPPNMFAPGFQVACGAPGASGIPDLGATHSYVIRARDTTPAVAAVSGSVICPADIIPINNVILEGPDLGSVGVVYDFTATVEPASATVPISYLWQATDKGSSNESGDITGSASYSWDTPGTKTITVTVANDAGPVSATHTIVIARPVTQVTLSGPAFGETGVPQTFAATAKPVSATTPLAYTFRDGDLLQVTRTGGLTEAADLTWDAPGTKAVTVTVTNDVGAAHAFATIHIEDAIAGLTARNNGPTDLGGSTRLEAVISGGTDVKYAWTFGDGGKATTRVANHVYTTAGSFTATVTASNDLGSKSASTTVVVRDPTSTGSEIFLPWTARR